MISEIEVVSAIKQFCKTKPDGTPSEWLDSLKKAPDGAKLRMSLAFWFSVNQSKMDDAQKDEYRKLRDGIERGLTREDLEFLSGEKLFPENTREHYKELMEKVPASGGMGTGIPSDAASATPAPATNG